MAATLIVCGRWLQATPRGGPGVRGSGVEALLVGRVWEDVAEPGLWRAAGLVPRGALLGGDRVPRR